MNKELVSNKQKLIYHATTVAGMLSIPLMATLPDAAINGEIIKPAKAILYTNESSFFVSFRSDLIYPCIIRPSAIKPTNMVIKSKFEVLSLRTNQANTTPIIFCILIVTLTKLAGKYLSPKIMRGIVEHACKTLQDMLPT